MNYKVIGLLLLILSCKDVKTETTSVSSIENYDNKTLQVYTTARDTKLRLTKTDEKTFKSKVQALETEVVVVVNTAKTFSGIFRYWWSDNRCFI